MNVAKVITLKRSLFLENNNLIGRNTFSFGNGIGDAMPIKTKRSSMQLFLPLKLFGNQTISKNFITTNIASLTEHSVPCSKTKHIFERRQPLKNFEGIVQISPIYICPLQFFNQSPCSDIKHGSSSCSIRRLLRGSISLFVLSLRSNCNGEQNEILEDYNSFLVYRNGTFGRPFTVFFFSLLSILTSYLETISQPG